MNKPKPGNGAAPPPARDEDAWSELDPMMRFGIRLAAILFCGVVAVAVVSALVALIA